MKNANNYMSSMKNLNSYITESIIDSNKAGIFSEEVFNKRIREEFVKAFKDLVDFKKKMVDPFGWGSTSGTFIHGWPVKIKKSDNDIKQAFTKSLDKFIKSIKQYEPSCWEIKNDLIGVLVKGSEIQIGEYPDIWYEDPGFNIALEEDIENETSSKFWLVLGYEDIGIDDIFDLENT